MTAVMLTAAAAMLDDGFASHMIIWYLRGS